jgi:hypothetical protein
MKEHAVPRITFLHPDRVTGGAMGRQLWILPFAITFSAEYSAHVTDGAFNAFLRRLLSNFRLDNVNVRRTGNRLIEADLLLPYGALVENVLCTLVSMIEAEFGLTVNRSTVGTEDLITRIVRGGREDHQA